MEKTTEVLSNLILKGKPVNKNSLLLFIIIFFICYLQIYLFKYEWIKKDLIELIPLLISYTICTSALYLFVSYAFSSVVRFQKLKELMKTEHIILNLGLLSVVWLIFTTYIGFLYNMKLKGFIQFSLILCGARWVIYLIATIIIEIVSENIPES